MAPEEKKLNASINLNTLITTITGLLIVAGILGVFQMKAHFEETVTGIKIEQTKMTDKIEHLQEGVTRLNSKVP